MEGRSYREDARLNGPPRLAKEYGTEFLQPIYATIGQEPIYLQNGSRVFALKMRMNCCLGRSHLGITSNYIFDILNYYNYMTYEVL